MKAIYSILAACALLTTGKAQLNITTVIAKIPPCALPCLIQLIPESTCGPTDIQCICTSVSLQEDLASCAESSCNFQDLEAVGALDAQLCGPYELQSRSLETKLVTRISLGITLVIVALRCYSRYITAGCLWWDDWFILAAALTIVLFISVGCFDITNALGRHLWYLTTPDIIRIIKIVLAEEFIYIMALIFTRLSLSFFYLRIFQHQKFFRKCVISMIIIVVATAVSLVITTGLQCQPLSDLWDLSKPRGSSCIDLNALVNVSGAIGIVQDIVILLLPVRELLKLQMDLKKKISVFIMFSIGLCACVTSMVRLGYLISFTYSRDVPWDSVDPANWSSIEIAVSVICACLPSIRVLLAKWLPNVLFFATSQKADSSNGASRKKTVMTNKRSLSGPSVEGAGQDFGLTVDFTVARELEEGQWGDYELRSNNYGQSNEKSSSESFELTQPSVYHQQH